VPVLFAAPHRTLFLAGALNLALASGWWFLHLLARQLGWPVWPLVTSVAPVWAHAFLMLFTVLPPFIFGFLFTTYPRWMNGPEPGRTAWVATAASLVLAELCWFAGLHVGGPLLVLACGFAGAGLAFGLLTLLRIMLAAEKIVSHAVITATGLSVAVVSLGGFGFGIATSNDFALHFAVRSMIWGGLLPVFFAVSHRMIPFFSKAAIRDYEPWRPTWVLLAVAGLAWLRLILGTVGWLDLLPLADLLLFAFTLLCAIRWTSSGARGNPLLWTLYAAFAWLPVAMLLQSGRDLGFVLSGSWALGLAPLHALAMGYFAGMLLAMVTRVTMGHSGRALGMDRVVLACVLLLHAATAARVTGELLDTPVAGPALLLVSALLWLAAILTWAGRLGPIYLAPRVDGRSG
jgi:uncharacterized protein involved in response to NO